MNIHKVISCFPYSHDCSKDTQKNVTNGRKKKKKKKKEKKKEKKKKKKKRKKKKRKKEKKKRKTLIQMNHRSQIVALFLPSFSLLPV